ncbi:MAG TPA: hypothetical protein VI336_03160 [Candidatus Saccharimonadales bacterium]|nr:hypothetical protein [Candidatus Saccharimonadales bacterium]
MSVASEQITKWTFFCKEVAKAKDTLETIEKTWAHINLNNNAYNQVFSLFIDALTTKVFLHLRHLFDEQNDSLRLSRIVTDKEDQAHIKKLKKEAKPFTDAVNRQHAHISKDGREINYSSNFRLMDEYNAIKIRKILDEVVKLLMKWGVKNNNGNVIADWWGNLSQSADVLFEHLEEYEFMRNEMPSEKYVDFVDRMRASRQ